MKNNWKKGGSAVIGIALLLAFFRPLLGWLGRLYLQNPTFVILGLSAIIVLIYFAVFFKEIFKRRNTKPS